MDTKVTACVFGGLGNQLFIYAMARAFTLRTKNQLYLDMVSGFINDPYKRNYSLHHFNIEAKKANVFLSFTFTGGRYFRYILRTYFSENISWLIYRKELHNQYYDTKVKEITSCKYLWLEGYWQSPLYFDDYLEEIRKDLEIISPICKENQFIASEINSKNSIAIHIRRLRNELVGEENALIKTLTLDYYYKAIDIISKQVSHPHFFCFSDSPDWVKENFVIPFPCTIVSHTQGIAKEYEDIWLMKQCQHFIISNSTFSWWGSFLSCSNKDKIILCPPEHFWDNQDIIHKTMTCVNF